MTVSPGKSLGARGGKEAAASTVLLVGEEGVFFKGELLKAGVEQIKQAESILEAVLMADGSGLEGGESGVIFAGVSKELDQIESAVRSLRKVYPQWRIVLLCDAGDEVVCRKAKGWGANDYLLLPLDGESLREALTVTTPDHQPTPVVHPKLHVDGSMSVRPAPAEVVRAPVAMNVPQRVEVASRGFHAEMGEQKKEEKCGAMAVPVGGLPGLPLMVQTVLLNDLMSGRSDFTERAVATLQGYLNFGGRLRFVAAEAEGDAENNGSGRGHEIRCAVTAAQQPTFGTLVLEVEDDAQGVSATVLLSQAAQLLGAMLAMARRYEQLRSLAITDELSGAYNRRYFTKWMTGLLERARLKRFRVTLMMFDIDNFKQYNDKFGHASGDAIIRELIKLLRTCSRSHDLVARLGGDEFAVVYWDNEAPRQPNSEHPKDALVATERFRKAIQEHHWADSCKIKGEVSISGGLATFPWDADTLEMLMEKADAALLRAKAAGKNAIVMHGKGGTEECGEGGE